MGGIKHMTAGQTEKRWKGQKTCVYHPSKSLELLCEVCMDLVCIECVPTAHTGHTFVSLGEITPLRKHEIHHFIDSTEDQQMAEIQQRISSTSDIFKQDEKGSDDLESYLKKQCDNIKADIDILKVRRFSEYHHFKARNMETRQIYSRELEMTQGDLLRYLLEYKTLLRDDPCDGHMFDKTVNVKPIENLSTLTDRDVPRCTPQKNHQDYLQQDLDTLTNGFTESLNLSNNTTSPWQLQTPSEGRFLDHHLFVLRSQYAVLPETNVLTKFKSPKKIAQICPTGDVAWSLLNNKITLLDRTGKIQQQRIYDVPIRAILVHPLTHQLYTFDDNGIIDLSTGARVFHYQATIKPLCLHFGNDGCILLGMTGKIAKIAPDGKHILTTTASASGKPFVFTPSKITECPLTGNLAFVDRDLQEDGGQGNRHVQVMDKEFEEGIKLSVETFNAKVKNWSKSRKQTCDIEFDKGGNLVLVDGRTIFLIDMMTEKAMRTIHIDKHPVISIGLGKQGELWVTLDGKSSKVKVLEYIEDRSG
ncbi:uncharacterized protein LOC110443906 [Mizuhopecten yessoensis]|nr:uncharacterized protein LOC110443906 [Mizuhopecten yessoensis]